MVRIIIAVCFSYALFLFPLNIESQKLSVITYNIKYDDNSHQLDNWQFRKKEMVDLLVGLSPQILGVQEALKHQVDYLDKALSEYTYVGVGRDDGISKGEFSPIFIDTTVFKIVESGTFWLSDTPGKVSIGWDAALERICTYALLMDVLSQRQFWVFNTHFDHKGELARLNSAKLILEKISQQNITGLPVILMGDFNLLPESIGIKNIKSVFKDCMEITAKAPVGPSGTFNGFDDRDIVNRIDYIFISDFKVEEFYHIDRKLASGRHISDHLPVKAVLRFK